MFSRSHFDSNTERKHLHPITFCYSIFSSIIFLKKYILLTPNQAVFQFGDFPPSICDRYKWAQFIFHICSAFKNMPQYWDARKTCLDCLHQLPASCNTNTGGTYCVAVVKPTKCCRTGPRRPGDYPFKATQNFLTRTDWAPIKLQFPSALNDLCLPPINVLV